MKGEGCERGGVKGGGVRRRGVRGGRKRREEGVKKRWRR